MRKMTVPLTVAASASVVAIVLLMAFGPAGFDAQSRPAGSYAEDRGKLIDAVARVTQD